MAIKQITINTIIYILYAVIFVSRIINLGYLAVENSMNHQQIFIAS